MSVKQNNVNDGAWWVILNMLDLCPSIFKIISQPVTDTMNKLLVLAEVTEVINLDGGEGNCNISNFPTSSTKKTLAAALINGLVIACNDGKCLFYHKNFNSWVEVIFLVYLYEYYCIFVVRILMFFFGLTWKKPLPIIL